MCSHYQALIDAEMLRRWAQRSGQLPLPFPEDLGPGDVWPLYRAPFLRLDPDHEEHNWPMGTELQCQVEAGQFGMLAHWAEKKAQARSTYNARTETVAVKPSFRDAWRRGQRCVIPAAWIYEPNWETGDPVPWKIRRADGEPLGIAGLWSSWRPPGGGENIFTFTMLTVNAEGHPLMQRFHHPEKEKRMVVILDPSDYGAWLTCPHDRMMAMMQRFPAEQLAAEPAPSPPRKSAAAVKSDPQQGELL